MTAHCGKAGYIQFAARRAESWKEKSKRSFSGSNRPLARLAVAFLNTQWPGAGATDRSSDTSADEYQVFFLFLEVRHGLGFRAQSGLKKSS
mmetsp:Transcript_9896/g.23776  ORF Transcript_9896/g.23776 Transcript_9896/m.23776 type:complete len:91 (-) Transcript_9896:195-467(-)